MEKQKAVYLDVNWLVDPLLIHVAHVADLKGVWLGGIDDALGTCRDTVGGGGRASAGKGGVASGLPLQHPHLHPRQQIASSLGMSMIASKSRRCFSRNFFLKKKKQTNKQTNTQTHKHTKNVLDYRQLQAHQT